MPEALKRLVERCWDDSHSKRPEFTEIYEEMYGICLTVPHDGPTVWEADDKAPASGKGCCSVS